MNANVAALLDRDRGTGFSRAGWALVDRDTAADVFSFWLLPAGSIEGLFQRLLDHDAFEFLPKGRRLAIVNQILYAQCNGVHAQLPRDDVDMRLNGESCLRAAGGPCLCARHLIRICA